MDAIFKIIAEAQEAAKEAAELQAKELQALRSFYGKNPQQPQEVDREKVREALQQLTGLKAEHFLILVGDQIDAEHLEHMQIFSGKPENIGAMFNEFMKKFAREHPEVIFALTMTNSLGL